MTSFRFPLVLAVAPLVLLLACGPGNNSPAPPSSVDEARQALVVALDTWRNQQAPAALAEREPPIVMNDHDWAQGKRLIDYQIQGEGNSFGNNVRFQVLLNLTAPTGRSQRAAALYVVATEPAINILRSDVHE